MWARSGHARRGWSHVTRSRLSTERSLERVSDIERSTLRMNDEMTLVSVTVEQCVLLCKINVFFSLLVYFKSHKLTDVQIWMWRKAAVYSVNRVWLITCHDTTILSIGNTKPIFEVIVIYSTNMSECHLKAVFLFFVSRIKNERSPGHFSQIVTISVH